MESKVSRKQVPPRREEKESAQTSEGPGDVSPKEDGKEMDIQLQGKIMLELQESHCKTHTT